MRVVVAPDSFKGVLDAPAAARAIRDGVLRARPDADVVEVPLADGGEGTLDRLLDALGGQRRVARAHGPLGDPIDVPVGLIRDASTAVIELAAVAGHALVDPARRDPLKTTTYGLGEVLRAVIDTEIDNVILAIGGSATVDGGAGMMQALGLSLLDAHGKSIEPGIGGGGLSRIARVRWRDPPERLAEAAFTIACDVLNPACGPNGAAAVFAPQKGAEADAVRVLEAGLLHWAELLESIAGRPLRNEPGTGAAGGVVLPLLAMTSTSIVPGVDLVCEACKLADVVGDADLVFTGEGRLDAQSMMGKVVGAVGRMCRSAGVPCVALVGCAGPGADECLSVLDRYVTLDGPLDQAAKRLADVAERIAREWR